MIKLIIWFNLRKLIVDKEMTRLYFGEINKEDLKKDMKKEGAKLEKIQKKENKTDKEVVAQTKMEIEFHRVFGDPVNKKPGIHGAYKQLQNEIEYFEGLITTIKENFWK